jgi:hypothetical protein
VGIDVDATIEQIDGKVMAAFVRGTKPASAGKVGPLATAGAAAAGCCAPGCCN